MGVAAGGDGVFGFLSASGGEDERAEVRRRAVLFDGAIVVVPPQGYCIDARSLRDLDRGRFVLLASCESLSGHRGQPVQPAVMTLTALPRADGAERPSAGQIAASMAPAEALETIDADGLSLVRLSAGGDRMLPGGAPVYWRGGMQINGHVLGLAAYGPQGSDIGGAPGRELLIDLAENLRAHSPDRPAVPERGPAPDAATETVPPLAQLLSGLFANSD